MLNEFEKNYVTKRNLNDYVWIRYKCSHDLQLKNFPDSNFIIYSTNYDAKNRSYYRLTAKSTPLSPCVS